MSYNQKQAICGGNRARRYRGMTKKVEQILIVQTLHAAFQRNHVLQPFLPRTEQIFEVFVVNCLPSDFDSRNKLSSCGWPQLPGVSLQLGPRRFDEIEVRTSRGIRFNKINLLPAQILNCRPVTGGTVLQKADAVLKEQGNTLLEAFPDVSVSVKLLVFTQDDEKPELSADDSPHMHPDRPPRAKSWLRSVPRAHPFEAMAMVVCVKNLFVTKGDQIGIEIEVGARKLQSSNRILWQGRCQRTNATFEAKVPQIGADSVRGNLDLMLPKEDGSNNPTRRVNPLPLLIGLHDVLLDKSAAPLDFRTASALRDPSRCSLAAVACPVGNCGRRDAKVACNPGARPPLPVAHSANEVNCVLGKHFVDGGGTVCCRSVCESVWGRGLWGRAIGS